MNRIQRAAILWLAPVVAMLAIDLGAGLSVPGFHAVISDAQARVGRPLTPVSVAGTARRTTRRVVRRTAYRVAALPPGCPYGPYYGGYYYYCGGKYYEQSGSTYVVVVFD
jgi:hypothetical protein